jgi:hypothetical protein
MAGMESAGWPARCGFAEAPERWPTRDVELSLSKTPSLGFGARACPNKDSRPLYFLLFEGFVHLACLFTILKRFLKLPR